MERYFLNLLEVKDYQRNETIFIVFNEIKIENLNDDIHILYSVCDNNNRYLISEYIEHKHFNIAETDNIIFDSGKNYIQAIKSLPTILIDREIHK